MHNSHQSFASRQRMLNYDGDASNQVIWFTAGRSPAAGHAFDQTPQALLVLDQWMRNIAAHPERGVAGNKPADASTPASRGRLAARERRRTSGTGSSTTARRARARRRSRRSGPRGPSRAARSRAASSSASCSRSRGRSRAASTARGRRRDAEIARLNAIFPTGVCDYSKRDAGCRRARPAEQLTRPVGGGASARPPTVLNPACNRHLPLFGVSPVAQLLRFD